MDGDDESIEQDSWLRQVAAAPSVEPGGRADWSGRRVGRFELLGKLGAGGMGVVYEAYDSLLDRRVALKILLRSNDEEARRRFVREGKSASRVTHPHVAAIYEAGDVEEVSFLAMELVEGATLRQKLRESPPRAHVIRWLREIAEALGAAHDQGVVHRDVKPENVMIRADGHAIVVDFGIATALTEPPRETHSEALTRDGRPIGTLSYMAPEQLAGDKVDGRADQFAWGVMAFEALGDGKLPWGTPSSPVRVVADVMSKPPGALPGDVPRVLANVVRRALDRDPSRRFVSMRDVVRALVLDRIGAPPPPPFLSDDFENAECVDDESETGRTLVLAGRTAEAIPQLERVLRSCRGLKLALPQVQSALYLGMAREANGDRTAACRAYQIVVDRWGHAVPRSVTLEKARARFAALDCEH